MNILYKLFLLLFPTAIIISQFISVGPINASWLLYLFISLLVTNFLSNNIYFLYALFLFIILPVVLFPISFCQVFPSSLYFSILTGLFVCFFIISLNEQKVPFFMTGLFLSCLIFCALGVFECKTGSYLIVNSLDSPHMFSYNMFNNHIPIVAFANPNDAAQYLVVCSVTSSAYIFKKAKSWHIIPILILLLASTFYIILNAESNLAIMIFLANLAFAFLFFVSFHLKSPLISFVIVLLGIISLIVFVIENPELIDALSNDLTLVSQDDFRYVSRADIYETIIKSSLQHPLGGFGNAYTAVYLSPHNFFLFVLSDFGFLFFMFFLFIYFSTIKKLLHLFKKTLSFYHFILLINLLLFPVIFSISSCNEQRKVLYIFIGLIFHELTANKSSVSDIPHDDPLLVTTSS